MLSRYPQVVKDTSGRTNQVTHRIRTTDCIPVRQKPYRIPQAYREEVNKELEEMEQSGIIAKSKSEWASVGNCDKEGWRSIVSSTKSLNLTHISDATDRGIAGPDWKCRVHYNWPKDIGKYPCTWRTKTRLLLPAL